MTRTQAMHLWSSGVLLRFPVVLQKKSYNRYRDGGRRPKSLPTSPGLRPRRRPSTEEVPARTAGICAASQGIPVCAGYGDVLWNHNCVLDAAVEVCLQSAWGSPSLRPLSGLPTHVRTANWRTSDTRLRVQFQCHHCHHERFYTNT